MVGLVATASGDGSIRLWDVTDWSPVSRLRIGGSLLRFAWGLDGIYTAAHRAIIRLDVVTPRG